MQAGLTPVKDDKLKYAKITPFQADSDSYCQAWFVRSKKTIKAEKSHIICDFSTFIILFYTNLQVVSIDFPVFLRSGLF